MPKPKASLAGRDCPLGKTLEHPWDLRWKGLERRIKTLSTQTHTHKTNTDHMSPCLTLLSGCSEGERRDLVTQWDITHIHIHKFMHNHMDTHNLGPYWFTHTTQEKYEILSSPSFLLVNLFMLTSFIKLSVAAPKAHCFSLSYLFEGCVRMFLFSFLIRLFWSAWQQHLLYCFHWSKMFAVGHIMPTFV